MFMYLKALAHGKDESRYVQVLFGKAWKTKVIPVKIELGCKRLLY